jgi:hypothetical protein
LCCASYWFETISFRKFICRVIDGREEEELFKCKAVVEIHHIKKNPGLKMNRGYEK